MLNSRFMNAINYVFAAVLSLSLLFSLVTSFRIAVNTPVVIISTIIFTAAAALVSICVKKRSKFLISVAVVLGVAITVLLLSMNTVVLQLNYAINNALNLFSHYYGVPSDIDFAEPYFYSIAQSDYYVQNYPADNATVLFVFLSVFLSLVITIAILRLKRNFIAVIVSLLILIPCFILTDTMPAQVALFASVIILITLYVTAFMRRTKSNRCAAATPVTALALAVVLFIVNAIYPFEDFERFEWQDELLLTAEELLNINGNGISDIERQLKKIGNEAEPEKNLSDLPEFKLTGEKVMEVKTNRDGKLLLKGMAYANYEDNSWTVLNDDQTGYFEHLYEYTDDPDINMGFATITQNSMSHDMDELSITTKNKQKLVYIPYYTGQLTENQSEIYDICVVNDNKTKSYTIKYNDYNSTDSLDLYPYTDPDYSINITDIVYTKLPNNLMYELKWIADENGLDAIPEEVYIKYSDLIDPSFNIDDDINSEDIDFDINNDEYIDEEYYNDDYYYDEYYDDGYIDEEYYDDYYYDDDYDYMIVDPDYNYTRETAKRVEEFIKGCAKYSYKPDAMPKDEDFALWFINDAEYGYCVHFATAATLMLRALNIPARYVTGYSINASKDKVNVVTTDNAHAWVEYYDDEIGWVPMDPTPEAYIKNSQTVQSTINSISATTQSSTTAPSATAKVNNKTHTKTKIKLSAVDIVCIIFGVVIILLIAVVLKIKITRRIREKRFKSGKMNMRAVYIFRYLSVIKKYSKNAMPQYIVDIAEKARFSRHQVTNDEVDVLLKYTYEERRELLENCSKLNKLYYIVIIAI